MLNSDKDLFKPTVEWMREKYDEMNAKLFNGMLGECGFFIFTSGRGSNGRTLGYFQMKSPHKLKCNRYTRKMFIEYRYSGERVYIDRKTFELYCYPSISINGNYSGKEEVFLNTLVHEMCHYYTYMNGFVPTQAHGREFRDIASIVSSRSGGLITIKRLASAEEMSNLELDDEVKLRNNKRLENKKKSLNAVFRFFNNGKVELTTTSSQKLIDRIITTSTNKLDVEKIIVSNDMKLINILFDSGYNVNMRKWAYWNVSGKDFLTMIDSINKIEYKCAGMNESEVIYKELIKEVVDEYVKNIIDNNNNNNNNGDSIEINPNLNLGLYSPFE